MSLTCFQAYDIRGRINIDIDEDIAYRIGRAVGQHFSAKSVIVGFDARETSFSFARAVACGIKDSGSNVLDIGLAGTEEILYQ
jgi:phosphomannomutase